MAGFDNTDTSEGTRHYPKIAIGFAIAGFFLTLYALPVYGYYLVSTSKENIKTECYWITDNTFHICGNREIPLSEITGIDESNLTEQEYNKSKEDKAKFFKELDNLSKPEGEVNEDLNSLNTLMDTIIKKKTAKDKTIKPDIKKAFKDINLLSERVQSLKERWMSIVIPSKNLLVLREIKTLELNSIHSICRDYKEYLDDWSPTIREYAKEHIRQKGVFEASFKFHLEDLKKEKTSDDTVM
jgi:DNA-binding Xre family transcriptional regulator